MDRGLFVWQWPPTKACRAAGRSPLRASASPVVLLPTSSFAEPKSQILPGSSFHSYRVSLSRIANGESRLLAKPCCRTSVLQPGLRVLRHVASHHSAPDSWSPLGCHLLGRQRSGPPEGCLPRRRVIPQAAEQSGIMPVEGCFDEPKDAPASQRGQRHHLHLRKATARAFIAGLGITRLQGRLVILGDR